MCLRRAGVHRPWNYPCSVSSARRRFVEAFSAGPDDPGPGSQVEVALARAQAEHGVIPSSAAEAIRAGTGRPIEIDRGLLEDGTRLVGYPILPLLQQLGANPSRRGGLAALRCHHAGHHGHGARAPIARRLQRHRARRCRAWRRSGRALRGPSGLADGRPDPRPAGCADQLRHEGGRLAGGDRPLAGAPGRDTGGRRGGPAVRGGRHLRGLRAPQRGHAPAHGGDPGSGLRRRAVAQRPGPPRAGRRRPRRAGCGDEPDRSGGHRLGPQRDRRGPRGRRPAGRRLLHDAPEGQSHPLRDRRGAQRDGLRAGRPCRCAP